MCTHLPWMLFFKHTIVHLCSTYRRAHLPIGEEWMLFFADTTQWVLLTIWEQWVLFTVNMFHCELSIIVLIEQSFSCAFFVSSWQVCVQSDIQNFVCSLCSLKKLCLFSEQTMLQICVLWEGLFNMQLCVFSEPAFCVWMVRDVDRSVRHTCYLPSSSCCSIGRNGRCFS